MNFKKLLCCFLISGSVFSSDGYITLDNGQQVHWQDLQNLGYVTDTEIPEKAFPECVFYNITKQQRDEMLTEKNAGSIENHKITELHCPSTLKKIGERAFSKAESLTKVTFNNGLEEIGCGAFIRIGTEQLEIPGTVKEFCTLSILNSNRLKELIFESGVEKISGSLLCGCDHLETVVVPSSVKILNGPCFTGCQALDKLDFPQGNEVTEIGDGCFTFCCYTPPFEFSEKIIKIGDHAFDHGQRGILIFPNVEVIGQRAFYSTKVNMLEIGSKVKSIGDDALAACEVVILGTESLENCSEKLFGHGSNLRELRLYGKTVIAESIIRNLIKAQKNLLDAQQNDPSDCNYTKIIYCDPVVRKNILQQFQTDLQKFAENPNFEVKILSLPSNDSNQENENDNDSQSGNCLVS